MSKPVHFKFRLYTAGDSQNSAQALVNLKALCAQHLPGRYEIEVVDVFVAPQRALTDEIRLTPTLLRLAPLPVVRIVGTLNQASKVLPALGLGVLTS